jgi:hypothetical protein
MFSKYGDTKKQEQFDTKKPTAKPSIMDKLRNDKSKICESCGVVHLGRHPLTCECKSCKRKRGGKKDRGEEKKKGGAMEG